MWMDPLLNYCRAYSLLVQQEIHVSITLDESKFLDFPAQNHNSQYKSNPNSRGRGIRCRKFLGG